MHGTHASVTVDAGTIPFSVLGLLGRDVTTLPGVWHEVPETPAAPGTERRCYRASGRAAGRPVRITVIVRAFRGRVWAVAVDADGYLFRLSDDVGEEAGSPYLIAVPRPPDVAGGTVNWITVRDGRPRDVGVAA